MKKRDTFEKGLSDFSPLGENCVTKASRRLCSFSSFPPKSNIAYTWGGEGEKRRRKGKERKKKKFFERSPRGGMREGTFNTWVFYLVNPRHSSYSHR